MGDESSLMLMFWSDNHHDGELIGKVRSGPFSGEASAWFSRDQIKEEFIERIRKYPLEAAVLEGGFWSPTGPNLEQCHLRISIKQHNLRGDLVVQVNLATQAHASPDDDLQQTTTVRFLTQYEPLQRFALEFEQLLDGTCQVATLSAAS